MAITPLPTPVPSSGDPANFDARADAFLGALPAFATEANALAAQVNVRADEVDIAAAEIAAAALVASDAAGLVGRSNSLLVVGAGTKNITLLVAKPSLAVLNKRVVIVQISDPTIRMFGTISSVTSPTVFAVTVVSSGSFGSGSYSSWQIIDAAFFGAAATAADVRSGVTDVAAMSPKPFWEAQEAVAVAYAGSMQIDLSAGMNFTTTVTGAPSIGQPLNMKVGQDITWTWEVGATAGQPSFNSTYWKRPSGTPTFSTTLGQKNVIVGKVMPGSPPYILWDLKRNPV